MSATALVIGSHNSDQYFAAGGTVYVYERHRDGITSFTLVKTIAPTVGTAYLGLWTRHCFPRTWPNPRGCGVHPLQGIRWPSRATPSLQARTWRTAA